MHLIVTHLSKCATFVAAIPIAPGRSVSIPEDTDGLTERYLLRHLDDPSPGFSLSPFIEVPVDPEVLAQNLTDLRQAITDYLDA